MKKLSFLICCILFSATVLCQKTQIYFDVKEYDFGKIKEADGNVTHVFEFVNKGKTPLVVSKVQASCGCTSPSWTKEPIAAGKKGTVTATYSPTGRSGAFTKTITVFCNDTEEQIVLTIKGEVIPK